uniref:Uncharacterized protein n=1 Tax=Oryza meridionalis TaxID=40149 RepID=A0A0E0D2Y1_9ORYZ
MGSWINSFPLPMREREKGTNHLSNRGFSPHRAPAMPYPRPLPPPLHSAPALPSQRRAPALSSPRLLRCCPSSTTPLPLPRRLAPLPEPRCQGAVDTSSSGLRQAASPLCMHRTSPSIPRSPATIDPSPSGLRRPASA